jgi:hypothetical protein
MNAPELPLQAVEMVIHHSAHLDRNLIPVTLYWKKKVNQMTVWNGLGGKPSDPELLDGMKNAVSGLSSCHLHRHE